jgi:two-component system, NarL family, invasion response regulator UvrY
MMRILIADDHAVVRKGLRQILEEASDIVVGGEASNGREVLEKIRAGGWDALVLDITMPGQTGLEVLKEVKQEAPRLPVLMLSMHAQEQYATRVLKAGASGYLPKESAPEELIKAIRKVCSGGKYVSADQAEKLIYLFDNASDKAPHELLSDREFEVLRAIASGRTVSQIAAEVHLSVKTVSTYRARILEKMRMKTNAELTTYAVRNGLVQ